MKQMRIVLLFFLIFSFLFPVLAEEKEKIMMAIKAGDLFEINKILASPEMEGRLSGTEGYDKAAKWVASKFEEWGLSTVYNNRFFQPFKVDYNEMRETTFSLTIPSHGNRGKSRTINLNIYKDFCPTLYSGFGDVESEVVFAGFGISAPELGWDDYKNIDTNGKIVAILRGTPQVKDKDFSRYSPRQTKLLNAKKHGAAGLILIYMAVVSGSGNYVEELPMVMVGENIADSLFVHKGYDMKGIKALLRDGHGVSFSTGIKAKIETKGIHHTKASTNNVVGMIEGSDPTLKNEYLIFGGHLDHLGPWPVLHPGASDNASGSTIVMGLAHAFSKLKKQPKRSIVFALFAAEELGLLGSKYMAAHLPNNPSKPIFMSNHDMNGVGTSLHINGGKTYPELYKIIEHVNLKYSINKNVTAGEISSFGGNSDYAPFLEKGIPAYSSWVRGGQQYGVHTEEDSIYLITPQIMEDIVRLYFMAGYLFADK